MWGGAALWLFYQGTVGWGIFMLLWGLFLISGVDNVVKPMLISRGSNLPFALVLFGVMGECSLSASLAFLLGRRCLRWDST